MVDLYKFYSRGGNYFIFTEIIQTSFDIKAIGFIYDRKLDKISMQSNFIAFKRAFNEVSIKEIPRSFILKIIKKIFKE